MLGLTPYRTRKWVADEESLPQGRVFQDAFEWAAREGADDVLPDEREAVAPGVFEHLGAAGFRATALPAIYSREEILQQGLALDRTSRDDLECGDAGALLGTQRRG